MEGEEGRREEWKVTANGHRICFGADESILKLIMKIIMQLCKWLNCMVCKLYSNKDVILKIASPIPSVQVKMWILSYVNYISTKQLLQMEEKRTSLAVQWLRLWSSNRGGTGSIPGWGTKILHSEAKKLKRKHTKIPISNPERAIVWARWPVSLRFIESYLKQCKSMNL